MKSIIALTLLAVASIVSADLIHDPSYCYATDVLRQQQPRWSDRTSNRFIRGTVNPNVSSCTPAKFWLYMRHGDRLPSTNDINRMTPFSVTQRTNIINAYLAGRSGMCLADFNTINNWNWNPNITVAIEQFLTVGGWNVVRDLAQRFQTNFPTLLPRNYSPNQFSFRHTDRQRTQATVRAFSDGLFGEGAWQTVNFPLPPTPDHLLRPHDDCPAYTTASSTEVIRGQWQNSPEFQAMLTRVNDKLGLTGGQRLTARQTRTMWEICQFEQLWFPNQDAPFCGAFSPFDNLRLEYFEDIDAYYTAGWGLNPLRLGENLNCGLMQDLLQFLTSSNPNEETARIYSTHQTAFQLFLLSLGVFGEDAPLLPGNFDQLANRQWVTSRIAPMATNIAVVRYNCPDGDDDVLFLMNERPLVIPGCAANGVCKVNFITQRYSRFLGATCSQIRCSTL